MTDSDFCIVHRLKKSYNGVLIRVSSGKIKDDGHDCHLVASIAIERCIVALHLFCGVRLHARCHTASSYDYFSR